MIDDADSADDREARAWDAFRRGRSLDSIARMLGVTPSEADKWIDQTIAANAAAARERDQKAERWSPEAFAAWAARREIAARTSTQPHTVRAHVRNKAAELGIECPTWAALQRARSSERAA